MCIGANISADRPTADQIVAAGREEAVIWDDSVEMNTIIELIRLKTLADRSS